MSSSASTPARTVDLGQYVLSAKIDFVTLWVPGRCKLPPLDGKPKWSRKEHYKRLSIHDATARDIESLLPVFPDARIAELEVAVDFRCANGVQESERISRLGAVMIGLFAMGLQPQAGAAMITDFRAYYRRVGEKGYVRPFNFVLPKATDQQLHGGHYHDAQVKAYLKRTDQGQGLSPDDYVARIEVALRHSALMDHDLLTIDRLRGFSFRKKLMPYFRHTRGADVNPKRCRRKDTPPWVAAMYDWKRRYLGSEWEKSGVGRMLDADGGLRPDIRLLRDTDANHRIGQALTRLEQRFRQENRASQAAPNRELSNGEAPD